MMAVSDALIVAILGAAFNAGVVWGTLRGIVGRVRAIEADTARAHSRIDDHIVNHPLRRRQR